MLWAAVVTASLAFLGTVAVAWLANRNRKTAKDVASEILDALDTGNNHTAGQALSRIETQLWSHENRLDSIDVRLEEGKETFDEIDDRVRRNTGTLARIEETLDIHVDEATARFDATEQKIEQHIYETRPLRNWVVEQIEKEGLDG